MVAQFTSDPDAPSLSPSVRQAAEQLPQSTAVPAAALVEAILDRHQEDYADGLGRNLDLAVDDPAAEQRPVTDWLVAVRDLYDAAAVPELHGRAVIIGLSLLDDALRQQLEQDGFLATLESEYREPLSEVLTEAGRSFRTPTDRVPTQPDRPVVDPGRDQLHRNAFARFLAHRVAGVMRSNAYIVNLYGPWGSGKTTLLNFMDAELSEGVPTTYPASWIGPKAGTVDDGPEALETEWQVVRFNAWQHQHVDPPWWALMDSVYRQSRSRLGWRDRLMEAGWRLRAGRLPFFAAIATIAWILVLVLPRILAGTATVASLGQLLSTYGGFLAAIVTFWAGMKAAATSLFGGSARAAQSYVDYVSDPMNTIEDRFNTLIDRIPRPVAIFIDDLDRCDEAYVVDLLEGIQTLFTDAPVVFVIAADRDWIEVCFDQAFADQKAAVDAPGRSLGGLFLEKTFQFSTPVPTIPDELKADYWDGLLVPRTDDAAESDADATPETSFDDVTSEDDILRVLHDSADRSFQEEQSIREDVVTRLAAPEVVARTEHLLSPMASLLEPNPRAMKRLVNAYSVNRALMTLGHIDIDRPPLALWTILSIQYPDFAVFLAERPEAVAAVGDEPPTDVPENVAPLFTDDRVVDIVEGAPVDARLDESTITRCAKIRP